MKFSKDDIKRFESRFDTNGPEVTSCAVIKVFPEIQHTRCHQWTAGISGAGYGIFTLNVGKRKYKPVHIGAHVFAYAIYVGRLRGQCCHKCDNKCCVNPFHLFDGTVKDNAQDRQAKGRGAPQAGEHNPASVITDDIVRRIRAKHDPKKRNGSALAREFGITQPLVSMIVSGQRWRHVK